MTGSRVLYIATNASAGMRHFVVHVLKAMFESTAVECYAILVSEPGSDYRRDIPGEYVDRVVFLDAAKGKRGRIGTLIYPRALYARIRQACEAHQVNRVHLLTEDPCLSSVVGRLKRRCEVYYTVHDLDVHEIRFRSRLHQAWYYWSHRQRVEKLMKRVDNLVTCSSSQRDRLKRLYPGKRVFYHPFPSLVTDNVKAGRDEVAELRGVRDYVLFFGRVEKYKGIEVLYKAFRDDAALKGVRLVVAGKGFVDFEREALPNVVWVNRFIRDEEVGDLFRKAKCVVFPYLSATQSGVFSFAFYFGKPVVASDVPFFREFSGLEGWVTLFKKGDAKDLAEKLKTVGERGVTGRVYEQVYGESMLKQALEEMYRE